MLLSIIPKPFLWITMMVNKLPPEQVARSWFQKNAVILDTETTGVGQQAEMCELAIIDLAGNILFSGLIKPFRKIPLDAIRVHGIKNEDVAYLPSLDVYDEALTKILDGRLCISYNSEFDSRIMDQSFNAAGLLAPNCHYACAMKLFAEWRGEWDTNNAHWAWWKLGEALNYVGGHFLGQSHRALSDCFATLDVIKGIANNIHADSEDVLFKDAAHLVINEQRVSVSMIQRHFKIGYNRASRIVEALEKEDIISPMGLNGARNVLVK